MTKLHDPQIIKNHLMEGNDFEESKAEKLALMYEACIAPYQTMYDEQRSSTRWIIGTIIGVAVLVLAVLRLLPPVT